MEGRRSKANVVWVFPEEEVDGECPICYHVITKPVSISCGHVFCLRCIRSHSDYQQVCPLCRKELVETSFNVNERLRRVIQERNPEEFAKREEEIKEEELLISQLARVKLIIGKRQNSVRIPD